jgi:hypothetical protein
MTEAIGTVRTTSGREDVTVEQNGNGTWTVSGPHMMRDYASRKSCVRFAKHVFADASNEARWYE